MGQGAPTLFEIDFRTARPPNPVYCHQEFLEKLAAHGRNGIGKRAMLLLQRLAVDERLLHYKATHGVNRGWRRSRLGGNSGSHFYAWWAPRGAPPIKGSGRFTEAPEGALFLRDIRHHDDHSPLDSQSLADQYLPLSVPELRREEYGPAPWTPQQARFASARAPVRILKGHPGSGKTTALWHAADAAGAPKTLYVTYSRELAALAKEYFDRYCSAEKQFRVVTFPALVREILGPDAPRVSERDSRKRFSQDLAPFARSLGVWQDQQEALYDEMHAHLAGDALPEAVGRFAASKSPRVADPVFRERRSRLLGTAATATVLDMAGRLERDARLAERYFPELELAWRAVEKLGAGEASEDWATYDVIAVDECQDLTPIESMVILEIASWIDTKRHRRAQLLMAGDEAQTVRPTDFEWGWMNDLLHSRLGTPQEFKLSTNLRSPRRIANLVNHAWDLYGHLVKQDRPSGSGYAEIDDDATDQIFYCAAVPGPELNQLLSDLASREGMAMIALDPKALSGVPESIRPSVLSVSEAKGLDFHSVCILDPGKHLDRITKTDPWMRANEEVNALRKRLAIDQLRVALSRPSERMFWIDFEPADRVVRLSLDFLNQDTGMNTVAVSIPAAVLKTLEEDQLDLEERIQRCQADARQFLEVRPEIALSRAQQAVTLLGQPGSPAAILDDSVRQTAFLTLAEVSFKLAFRNVRLAAEMGRPDLYRQASKAAVCANRYRLDRILSAIERVHRAPQETRLEALAKLAETLPESKSELTPWILVEIEARSRQWIEEIEAAMFNANNASILSRLLPPFYEVLGIPDGPARAARLREKTIHLLMKEKKFAVALQLLASQPERQLKLEAVCHEGLREYHKAAECYRAAGMLKEALQCHRAIPDFEATLALVREIGDHPAAESLEWIARLRKVIEERPEKFGRVITAAEKKLLEDTLERALGVQRKKPAPRKTAPKRGRPASR